MRFLPPEEQVIVERAQALGVEVANPPPAYLSPALCTALSLLLVVPTLGYSLIFVPIFWVVQHDRTANRIIRLRRNLEKVCDPQSLAREPLPPQC
ncbi:MAG: hypothetical protein ACK55H_04565 [Cyanobacteriota bacterium]|jgi:hypothetical protein